MKEEFMVNRSYTYPKLQNMAGDDWETRDYGPNMIGENVLVLVNERQNMSMVFVLSSATKSEYYYTCLYIGN